MSKDHLEIVQRVDRLRDHIHDLIDDAQHPYGRQLLKEIEQLVTDVKVKRHRINIEQRIQGVMGALGQIRGHGDQIMDFRHTDRFMKDCIELSGKVREFYPY